MPESIHAVADISSEASERTVTAFFSAWEQLDTDTVLSLVSDDIVFHNVSLSTVRGRARFARVVNAARHMSSFDVKIHRIAASGAVVLTERTDLVAFGPLRLRLWACGIFEVHDGRITLWRDYFDYFDVTRSVVRGLIGVVVPSLRPKLG